MGHHETKVALAQALASLVTPDPAGPVASVRVGRPDLFSDLHRALCVFSTGSENPGGGSDEGFLPSSFLYAVAGVHPAVPTVPGMGATQMRQEAEEAASRALSAWLEALTRNPTLSGLADIGRPVLRVTVLSERSDDADQFGNPYADASNRAIWICGSELRVDLMT